MRRIFTAVCFLAACSLPASAYDWSTNPGDGSEGNPYQIWEPAQLDSIGYELSLMDQCFVLTADINMSGYTGTQFNRIGNSTQKFAGTFDGQGHTIHNLTYSTTSSVNDVGLFGYASGATIQDLTLANVRILVRGNYHGGLAGRLVSCTVSRCRVEGTITGDSNLGGIAGLQDGGLIEQCFTEGTVFKNQIGSCTQFGGLVGLLKNGTIDSCESRCAVTGDLSMNLGGLAGSSEWSVIRNSFSAGSVSVSGMYSNGFYTGGITGYQYYTTLENCFSSGPVVGADSTGGITGNMYGDSSRIENCYSTGAVTGQTNAGGIIGSLESGTVSGSFWDVQTSGIGTGGDDNFGAIGKWTAQMQDPNTFLTAGWDLRGEQENGTDDLWTICGGTNYPRLVWQIPEADFVCPDGVGLEDADAFGQCWLTHTDLDTEHNEDGDTVVGMEELAQIGKYWLMTGCGYCGEMDFTDDGDVTMDDLTALAEDWLIAVHPECGMADMNGDEFVDLADWADFAAGFLEGM